MTPNAAIPKPGLSATIDKRKVDAFVKDMLKDGVPDFIKHPHDYKNWLDEEQKAWAEELRKREQVLPELQPVILLRVEAGNG